MAASTAYSTGAEFAGKLSPKRLPEIRDRALKALASKVELGLLPCEVALEIPGLPQLVLHWLNDRQEVEPQLLNAAFKLLAKLAKNPDTTRLHEAGCVAFLQDFRPQAPSQCLDALDAALWALLCHRPEAIEPSALCSTPLRPGDSQVKATGEILTPPKSLAPRELQTVKLPLPEVCQNLGEADQQLLLDMSVRLKFSASLQRSDACRELFNLASDVPPQLLLSHGPVLEGLCLCLHDPNSAVAAADALRLLLERLHDQRLHSIGKDQELPALWHFLAQLLSGDLCFFAQHALRKLQQILHLDERGDTATGQRGNGSGQQMLHCLVHAAKALRTQLAPSRQPLRCAAEALEWFRCLGLPDAQHVEKLPWVEPLFSHDWNPRSLLLMDVVLGLLAGITRLPDVEKLLASWAAENEVVATMVASLLFDIRLLWERPEAVRILQRAANVVAPQQERSFQMFLQMLEEGLPVDAAVKELGQELEVGREVALCQAAQLLQLGLGEELIGGVHRSVVWLRARRNFEHSDAQMLAPDELLLAPVSQGALLCPGYLAFLLGALTPTMWSQGGSFVVRFPDQEQLKVLEHVHDLLRTLPDLHDLQGEEKEQKDTRDAAANIIMDALKQLDDLVHRRLLPGLHALLMEDDSFGHAQLADAQLMRATELLLRVTLALLVRRGHEVERKEIDLSLLTILTSAPAPLPALALRLAVQLEVAKGSDQVHINFGEVLLERLSARSNTTRYHSTEIHCALWLSAEFAPAEAVAYVTPFLQHVDAVVSAAAWRCLRCLLFCRDEDDQEALQLQRRAAVQRALRALRAWSREELLSIDTFARAAEAVEVLRWSVEAGVENAKQILESGILVSMAKSFKASHLGLRRSLLRLLSALLAANFTDAAPVIFKAGLWTSVVSACEDLTVEEGNDELGELDVLTVKTDVVLLVIQGTGEDSQLLLWLSKSTALLQQWQWTLQSLGVAVQKQVGGHGLLRVANLLRLHLAALLRFMELPIEDSDFLFSWQVTVALGEALQADMPMETQQLATAALVSWAAIRMKEVSETGDSAALATLGTRASQHLLRVLSGHDAGAGIGLAECAAAANLFASSSQAAFSAAKQLPELSALLQQLSEQRRHQQLIWVMRVFFAMLISSEDALEGARAEGLLTSVLLALRSSADRDQALCLEFLEQLFHLSGQLQEELFQSELLSWLMRLSTKRQLASAAFCCVMDILCLCSDVLAGKPLLFRYLGQLMEAIRSLSKTTTLPVRWKSKRLVAAMNFISSLRLCSRSAAILTGAASGDSGTRRHLSAPLGAGLDLWFDFAGETPKGDIHGIPVRNAALRLLLALSEALPKASVEAWPRLMPLLQDRHCAGGEKRLDPREGLLQRLAEDDSRAAALCEAWMR